MFDNNDFYTLSHLNISLKFCFILNFSKIIDNKELARIFFFISCNVGADFFNNPGFSSCAQKFNFYAKRHFGNYKIRYIFFAREFEFPCFSIVVDTF